MACGSIWRCLAWTSIGRLPDVDAKAKRIGQCVWRFVDAPHKRDAHHSAQRHARGWPWCQQSLAAETQRALTPVRMADVHTTGQGGTWGHGTGRRCRPRTWQILIRWRLFYCAATTSPKLKATLATDGVVSHLVLGPLWVCLVHASLSDTLVHRMGFLTQNGRYLLMRLRYKRPPFRVVSKVKKKNRSQQKFTTVHPMWLLPSLRVCQNVHRKSI